MHRFLSCVEKRERESVCVCEREGERVCVCEREGERECVCANKREKESERMSFLVKYFDTMLSVSAPTRTIHL